MKKILILALLGFAAPQAHAASIRLNAEESRDVVEAFFLAGLKANTKRTIYTLRVSKPVCKSAYVSHAGSPDDVRWGMYIYTCDKPKVEGASAKLIYDAIDKLQTVYGDRIQMIDCAMGKCYTDLKLVSCGIDSREYETQKRFRCTLTDNQ